MCTVILNSKLVLKDEYLLDASRDESRLFLKKSNLMLSTPKLYGTVTGKVSTVTVIYFCLL